MKMKMKELYILGEILELPFILAKFKMGIVKPIYSDVFDRREKRVK